MRIQRLDVHGFRNVKNTGLLFKDILALISLNSFGKSNLLMALDFGFDFIQATSDGKDKMMRWKSGVPLNKQLADEDFKFEIEATTKVKEEIFSVIYGFQFRWVRDDSTGARIVGEWLKIKKDDKGKKYSLFISREDNKAKYKQAESGRCDHSINIDSNELVINKLQAYDNLFYLDIIRKINNLNIRILRRLDAGLSYTPDPIIRTDVDELEIDNIPRSIFFLQKRYPNKYELLINSFKMLFPDIKDIKVRETILPNGIEAEIPQNVPLKLSHQIYSLLVIDRNLNQPINFEYMSDGAKRIFSLLTCAIQADIKGFSLIAIEEPENCIHPSLLQHLLVILMQISGNCRVIITSHSPYLIQYLEPMDVYIGVPSNDGVAHFASIRSSCQKTLIRDAKDAGLSTGDYIFDLISGSDEDIDVLSCYLECDI